MAELNSNQKLELVTRIAQFEAYADIAAEMSEKHNIPLDRVQVRDYDPSKAGFAAGDKWRPIFACLREKYLADFASIPITNQVYRMTILQRGIDAALLKQNWGLAARLAEIAAKDLGGIYTKTRELAIRVQEPRRARDLLPVDRKAAFADLIRQALEQMPQTNTGFPSSPPC